MSLIPTQLVHLTVLLIAAVIFHAVLWARNYRYLWSQRRVILTVVVISEIWMLITDPIGGQWGAWYFARDKVMGIWFSQVMPIEDFLGIAVVSSTAACAVLVFGYSPRRWV